MKFKSNFWLIVYICLSVVFIYSIDGGENSLVIRDGFGIKDINSSFAKKLLVDNINNPDFVVLDIRTKKEYDENHIIFENSLNIDFYSVDFDKQILGLDVYKTYLVHCRSGHRSSIFFNGFISQRFKNAYHLKNGLVEFNK